MSEIDKKIQPILEISKFLKNASDDELKQLDGLFNGLKMIRDEINVVERFMILIQKDGKPCPITIFEEHNKACEEYDMLDNKDGLRLVRANVSYAMVDDVEVMDAFNILEVIRW